MSLMSCRIVQLNSNYSLEWKSRGNAWRGNCHCYHISSLRDREMKGEERDGHLVKGTTLLREDNSPQGI